MGKKTKSQRRQGNQPTGEQASFLRDAQAMVDYLEGRQIRAAMAQSFREQPDGTFKFHWPVRSAND